MIGVRFRYSKLLCNGCATAASASTTGIQPVAQPRARATAQPKQTTFKNAQQALETSGLQRATRAKGTSPSAVTGGHQIQIGRASCREREKVSGGAGSWRAGYK